jgi:hypothetical protein
MFEPQKRSLTPWLATGLASESKLDRIPYGRCEALPNGRTFPVACGGELQSFEHFIFGFVSYFDIRI